MIPPPILGVILAGGLSTRMGTEKAFMPLAGRPALAHVVGRLRPQVAELILNANGDPARFSGFGLTVVADDAAFLQAGPLAGILAALEHAAHSGFGEIATAPCDAPFLPRNMVQQLAVGRQPGDIACFVHDLCMEPLFALWPVGAVPALRALLHQGSRRARGAILALPHALVPFEARNGEQNPFLNLNRPGDVVQAARLITQD